MEDKKDILIEQEAEKAYQKAAEQFKYPKGIVDNGAYDNFLILSNQWKTHVQRYYKYKDKNKKVIELDLAQSPKYIEEEIQINKIPESEAKVIQKINIEIYDLVLKATIFKKKAFGDNRAVLGENGEFLPDELSSAKAIVIELSGRFFKAEEIYATLIQDLEITNISLYQIKQIQKDNIGKIKELQEKFKSDYSDCRLGYKRSRLEELEYLYRERKQIYGQDRSRENEKQLQSILEQVRKETDGDLVINGQINLEINNQAEKFVEHQIIKDLNISMFVLAKIAARMNVNPLLLISRLANSRYSQFTGYSARGLSATAQTDEIQYPSNILYNWNQIEAQNANIVEEDKKLAQLPEVKNPKQINNLKAQLLEKLNIAKKPLQAGKDTINKQLSREEPEKS